jgi:hypothetical protein
MFGAASSAFLSYQISISHQLSVSQQYFSLIINQHQSPGTNQPNKLKKTDINNFTLTL